MRSACWTWMAVFVLGMSLPVPAVQLCDESADPGITLAAYYYPWQKRHFARGYGYLRKELDTRQEPRLGEYDDTTDEVIQQHLEWSKQANIKVWVSSWWGPTSFADKTLRENILKFPDLGDHKIALLYETPGRIKKIDENNWNIENVGPDMDYICKQKEYFKHPNYLRVNGKPLIVVYLTRMLQRFDMLDDVISIMRSNCDEELFIVGDHVWQNAPKEGAAYPAFDLLDAVTNYDVYGNSGQPQYAYQEGVDAYYDRCEVWKERAEQRGVYYIPAVSPGYNDRAIRPEVDNVGLSRRLTPTSEEGSLLKAQMERATRQVNPGILNMILVNSFNEWHEDTQIEPCDGKASKEPFALTNGHEYVGYGELYLDILREMTLPFEEAGCRTTPFVPSLFASPMSYTGQPIANANVAAYYVTDQSWSFYAGGNFLRHQLAEPQSVDLPADGDLIGQHLALSRKSNIGTWICRWLSSSHTTNAAVLEILNYPNLLNHRILLLYEVGIRVAKASSLDVGMQNLVRDMQYICQTFFINHEEHYYRTDGGRRPVLFLTMTRRLERDGIFELVIEKMRDIGRSYGFELFLVGDHVWNQPPNDPSSFQAFELLDGVMNRDVYGNMDMATQVSAYPGMSMTEDYYEIQRQWRIAAWSADCAYLPTVTPGFNDRVIRSWANRTPLARRLTAQDAEGSFFAASLDKAKHLLDVNVDDLLIVNSFNNLNEESQILPIVGPAAQTEPMEFTVGLSYEGYGTTYLDLLTDRFGELPEPTHPPTRFYMDYILPDLDFTSEEE